jgi:hypothetical protein
LPQGGVLIDDTGGASGIGTRINFDEELAVMSQNTKMDGPPDPIPSGSTQYVPEGLVGSFARISSQFLIITFSFLPIDDRVLPVASLMINSWMDFFNLAN